MGSVISDPEGITGAREDEIGEQQDHKPQKDYTDDQMSIKEHIDPFAGQPVKEGE